MIVDQLEKWNKHWSNTVVQEKHSDCIHSVIVYSTVFNINRAIISIEHNDWQIKPLSAMIGYCSLFPHEYFDKAWFDGNVTVEKHDIEKYSFIFLFFIEIYLTYLWLTDDPIAEIFSTTLYPSLMRPTLSRAVKSILLLIKKNENKPIVRVVIYHLARPCRYLLDRSFARLNNFWTSFLNVHSTYISLLMTL